jgi:hypothetical protein
MKSFEKFLKEEIDIRKIKGLPEDFIRSAEEEAQKNLGVRPDEERQMMRLGPQIMNLIGDSKRLLTTGPDGRRLTSEQVKERVKKLEELAKKIVLEEYGDIISTSAAPVELDIKLVTDVISEIPKLRQVPEKPEEPQEEEEEQEEDQDEEKGECKECGEEKTECQCEGEKDEVELDFGDAISKKKILNMISQAAGKSTKDIIQYSETAEEEIKKIFGEQIGRQILDIWIQTSDVADKMDWIIPVERKASMMKGSPGGMAGAVELKWENYLTQYINSELVLESKQAKKIVIKAVGIDFPMLIHETVKGIYLLLQSSAIKKDKKSAEIIKKATSSFSDEAQDFRYGGLALQMLLSFVNKFTESNRFSQLQARVFGHLSIDKVRANELAESLDKNSEGYKAAKERADMAYTDKEFLEIMKSMFSVFDKVERGGKLEFVVNDEKFNKSKAKTEVSKIIAYFVEKQDEYERELREWEAEEREREEEMRFRKQQEEEELKEVPEWWKEEGEEKEEETSEVDYSKMSQRELQSLIDDALDAGDYEKVKTISGFLKEGKEIYLKELERINENFNPHTDRK